LPYIAKLEKAGIPTVVVDFSDQDEMIKQEALANGVPNVRFIHASRIIPGPEDVDRIVEPVLEGLTKPLTEKEKETGRWEPPQQRIIFEGTIDEAEIFFQQTKWVPAPLDAPICIYTDGYPIRVPTEERVKEMLTGTSHKPDEMISLQTDRLTMRGLSKKGEPVLFQPMNWTATVEKVATIAVMAGCKPEHLPVVLAIAESGCPTGTTTFHSQWVCISGPIVKEVKMNAGVGMLDPGNPANTTLGRVYQMMAVNLGGAMSGVNRMNSIGSPFNTGGTCCAENADLLPPGWKGLNEEHGFKKDESIVMVLNGQRGIVGRQFSPGGYRAFQKSGHGGIARRLDVKGQPGPHNWLEYLVPGLWANREGAYTFVMAHEMARHLHDIGFRSKEEVYEWLWKNSFVPLKNFRNFSWVDLTTNGWMGIEKLSGKHWKELPDDYMVPAGGDGPSNYCIIVCGTEEEICLQLEGIPTGANPIYSVDAWR